jgi:hypothetical protein
MNTSTPNQINKQPEPAKDEWRVGEVWKNALEDVWRAEVYSPRMSSNHINIQVRAMSRQEAEATAKQIVEDHNFKSKYKELLTELEQARALYQDRCKVIIELRKEIERLKS